MTTSPTIRPRTWPSSRSGASSRRHHHVRLQLHRRAGPAPAALRQGHAAPVDRQRPARLVARRRPRQPGRHARRHQPALRHRVVGQDGRRAQGRGAPALRGLALQPVHARRAGRADLHGQDRADRARHRLEVLRRHPGDRRGPPRRGVQPLPAREGAVGLPAQPEPQEPARRRHLRQPVGHDVPRDAGPHRGPGPGRLRHHPQHGDRAAWPRRSTPTSCRTRPATSCSAAWPCATTTRS